MILSPLQSLSGHAGGLLGYFVLVYFLGFFCFGFVWGRGLGEVAGGFLFILGFLGFVFLSSLLDGKSTWAELSPWIQVVRPHHRQRITDARCFGHTGPHITKKQCNTQLSSFHL